LQVRGEDAVTAGFSSRKIHAENGWARSIAVGQDGEKGDARPADKNGRVRLQIEQRPPVGAKPLPPHADDFNMRTTGPARNATRFAADAAAAAAQPAPTPQPVVDAGAPPKPDEPKVTERRRSRRGQVFSMGLLGMLRAVGAPDGLPAEQVIVTDVSLHGVGFRSPMKFTVDSMYFVELGVGPLHLSSRLRIARVQPRADGTYDVGAEFC
jgi:hypothetical protein